MTSVGRWTCSTSHAVVADLPVPVAPSSTTSCSPALTRRASSWIACGWSPAGWKSETTSNGATRRWRSVVGRMVLRYAAPPTAGPWAGQTPRGVAPSPHVDALHHIPPCAICPGTGRQHRSRPGRLGRSPLTRAPDGRRLVRPPGHPARGTGVAADARGGPHLLRAAAATRAGRRRDGIPGLPRAGGAVLHGQRPPTVLGVVHGGRQPRGQP